MSFTDVVGRGSSGAGTTTTTGTPTAGVIKNINDRLGSIGFQNIAAGVDVTVDEAIDSLTKAQKTQIATLLEKAGFTVRTPAELGYILSTAFPNVGKNWKDFPDLFAQIKDQIIAQPKDTEPSITRSIAKYDESVLKEVAQSIALKKRGAMLNDDELKQAVDLANSLISKGTVTETKKVRNPKTGKIENVVTTTPGFSQERFGVELGKKIEEQSPEMVERRKAFGFIDELQKIMSGGM
jgi:hypothetical protein